MVRGSLVVLALLCALIGAPAATAQDDARSDDPTGLYEPFPEPSAGAASSLFGAESGRSETRGRFAARVREGTAAGVASTRAGGPGEGLGLPPLVGPLCCAVGVLAFHGFVRRRTARRA